MSGHLRFCFAAFVLVAGLPTSSASSNPFSGFFNASPATASAPSSAEVAEVKCLSRPGRSTADGQRWVYRVEGRRRCWFQVAEGTEPVKMPVRYRAARYRAAAAEENKSAARKRKAMVDARAELQRSAAVDTSRPSPSAPVQVVDAGPILATGIATRVSPAPSPNAPTGSRRTKSRRAKSTWMHVWRPLRPPVTRLPPRRLRRRRSPFPPPRRVMAGRAGPGFACC